MNTISSGSLRTACRRSGLQRASLLLILLTTLPALAQLTNYTRLHSFGGPGATGGPPAAAVLDGSDGVLYGVTAERPGKHGGAVFKVKKDGTGPVTLHTFGATPEDGRGPSAQLVEGTNGFLYGTTLAGGLGGYGTLFKLGRDGSGYAILHHFGLDPSEGFGLVGGLSRSGDGALLGVTASAAGAFGGMIFTMRDDGGGFTVLHQFSDAVSLGENHPNGVMEASDGKLYGTTFGGNATNAGVLFRLNRNGSDYAVLHEFGIAPGDGRSPLSAPIEGTDGALYGTTFQGGSMFLGTIYRVRRDGGSYAVLHDFTNYLTEGGGLKGRLVEGRDGTLYGANDVGGGPQGAGAIFRVRKDGSGFTVLRPFGAGLGDGWQPAELIAGKDGAFYGATASGGAFGLGTVFRLGHAFDIARRPGGVTLRLTGVPGWSYEAQRSFDLIHWNPLAPISGVDSPPSTHDESFVPGGEAFYRLRVP